MRRRDGEHWSTSSSARSPLEVDDRRQLVVVVRDVTARRRAEDERERLLARAALLAEASELFDQSLDEQETMRSVARLCVRGDGRHLRDPARRRARARPCGASPRPPRDEERERELLAALDGRRAGPCSRS